MNFHNLRTSVPVLVRGIGSHASLAQSNHHRLNLFPLKYPLYLLRTMCDTCSIDFDCKEIERLYTDATASLKMPQFLKYEQSVAIHTILRRKDLLALLPTGFGKSLMFIAPSLILSKMSSSQSYTIVVSPLISLVEDGIKSLKSFGLRGFHWTSDAYDLSAMAGDIGPQEPIFILLSPEVLRIAKVREKIVALRPVLIAIDEGHLISEWGTAFRKDYGFIFEIRCWLDSPIAVFTATLTRSMSADVKKKAGIRNANSVTIIRSPNRSNIFLECKSGGKSFENLLFVADEIRRDRITCQKTIIFVPTTNIMANLFLWFHATLGEASIYENQRKIGYMVNMFSASTEPEAKIQILSEFVKHDTFLRVLICTVAYGLGIDNPNIRRVIIFGLPSSRLLLIQEIGRAGRDGLPSLAMIFPFRSSMTSSDDYDIPKDKCVRQFLLEPFPPEGIEPSPPGYVKSDQQLSGKCLKCFCCSVCRDVCDKTCTIGPCWP